MKFYLFFIVSTSFSSVEEFFNNSSTIFCVSSKPPLIFSESTTSGTAVRRLIKAKPQDPVATLPSSSQHIPHTQTGPVIIELLRDHTQPTDTPLLTVSNPLPNNCLKVSLSVDVLVLANITSPLRELAAVCREKLTTHLKSIAKGITWKVHSFVWYWTVYSNVIACTCRREVCVLWPPTT